MNEHVDEQIQSFMNEMRSERLQNSEFSGYRIRKNFLIMTQKFWAKIYRRLKKMSCPLNSVPTIEPACLIPKVIEKKNEMQWLYICIAFIGGVVLIVGASKLYWYCVMNKK